MKKNVSFMKKMLKIVFISIMFLFVVTARSHAATALNLDNIFNDIPDASSSSDGSGSSGQGSTTGSGSGQSGSSSNAGQSQSGSSSQAQQESTNKTSSGTTTSSESSKTKTNSTSSASKENIPETGSNTEIIFVIGAIVLVGTTIIIFKKQSIKLK